MYRARGMTGIMWWWAIDVAEAACERAVSPAELARVVAAGEQAWLTMDLGAFPERLGEARARIACLDAPIGVETAVGWHRLVALEAVTTDAWPLVVAEFRAVLAGDPTWEPSEALLPTGNPARERFDAARLAGPGASRSWRPPAGTTLYVDGAPRPNIPVDRPYLAQIVAKDGTVRQTEVLASGALPSGPEGNHGPNPALGWSAVGAGIGAAGLYGVALGMRAHYDDPATEFEDLDAIRGSTNGVVFASAGVGAVAVGLGVAALTVKW